MDQERLRKLSGISLDEEEINEMAVVSFRAPDEGPNITLSVGNSFGDTVDKKEASFSSFKVMVARRLAKREKSTDANFRELDKADTKVAEQKLKEITRLTKKFQVDVRKILEK